MRRYGRAEMQAQNEQRGSHLEAHSEKGRCGKKCRKTTHGLGHSEIAANECRTVKQHEMSGVNATQKLTAQRQLCVAGTVEKTYGECHSDERRE